MYVRLSNDECLVPEVHGKLACSSMKVSTLELSSDDDGNAHVCVRMFVL